MTLLEVADLNVAFPTADGVVHAVTGLTYSVQRGQTLAIVGESGSGKSVSVQALLGLTAGAHVTGQARFEGRDLLTMSEESLRAVRGAEVAMIFQDPLSALHPCYSVGWQIAEMCRSHDEDMSKKAARSRAAELLALVGIPDATRRADEYPHQFSGGMRQRAMIAMAMALHPKLLIADEPTTALDVTVQAQVLHLMQQLKDELGMAIIMITHDLRIVGGMADDVIVMYAGRVMEAARRGDLFEDHHHPYSEGLIDSLPDPGSGRARLTPIPGHPPSLITPPPGCPFHPRCRYRMERCETEVPPLLPVNGRPDHRSACWLPHDPAPVEQRQGDE